ncbi:MAG TPA: glycosyltransferase family A protein, partial [Solirubrobacterales bacterium]|nr:glycosyltransferase family A protein [Solirubrobacterales bacterium]
MNSITVVIPTKDRAPVLARTLSALGAQQTGDAEVEAIVVDNGSSDDTVERVRRLAGSAGLPIALIEHPGGGPAAAR